MNSHTHTHNFAGTDNSNYYVTDHELELTKYGVDRAATILHRALE